MTGPVKSLQHHLAALWRERSGATFVLFGATLPVILMLAGLGVDVGTWYQYRRGQQTMADAGAIAAAWEKARGNSSTAMNAAAASAAEDNGYEGGGSIVVNNPPTSGPNVANTTAVEVLIDKEKQLFLSSILLDGGMNVATRGVAALEVDGKACILSLDPTAQNATNFTGSNTTIVPGCVIAANSSDPAAINIGGSADVLAEYLFTFGGIEVDGGGILTTAEDNMTHAWPLPDPYADLTVPAFAGCLETNLTIAPPATRTLSPGVYCGGMRIRGTAHLTPGTYYLDGGDFDVNSSATVDCPTCVVGTSGVTIVLTRQAGQPVSEIGRVFINGGATVELTAPPSGDFAGILFYQDRRAPSASNLINNFNGGSTMNITGALYFPNQQVNFAGNNGINASECTQIIARIIQFVGNSAIDDTECGALGLEPANVYSVHLVE